MSLEVSIVGAGSVGSFLVYILNRAGIVPRLVFRRDPLREVFLRLRDREAVRLDYRPHSYDDIREWSSTDILILATKAYDAEPVLEDLRARGDRWRLLVLVQNGLRVFEKALELFGPERVAQIVLNHGIERLDTGLFRWNGGGTSYIGMSRGYHNKLLDEITGLLREIGVVYVEDIQPYRWLKLAVNAVINPVTALLGQRNRVVVENSFVRDYIARRVSEEVSLVARSYGVEMPRDPYEEVLRVARETGDNVSSMLRDISLCRKTEIDYINGAVVEYGARRGIKTYFNEALYYLVRAREETCVSGKDLS